LLQYLSTKYLEGAAQEIKEYQIGVEVLSRPATFDPAEDAGVRVEAHRLRKRLRDFYETEGSSHRLRIDVPLGHYAVVFQSMPDEPAPNPALNKDEEIQRNSPRTVLSGPVNSPARRHIDYRIAGFALLTVGLVTAAAIVARSRIRDTPDAPVSARASNATVAAASNVARIETPALAAHSSIRIACGRTKPQMDRWGEVWDADRDYQGGAPFEMPRQYIARAFDPKIFQAGRTGNFTYTIPLGPGVYELHLYFIEGTFGPALAGGGENSRLFDVLVNGKLLLTRFDVYSDAGGSNIADVRVFKDISAGDDHALTLTFRSSTDLALLNAIELTPAISHRLNPIRIIAQESFYTDSTGAVWKPDRYYNGGQSANHSVVLRGTRDPDLFARERYGHFDYAIPVDKGTYRLSLYFAEEYFGPISPHGGQVGTRVFDVICNGLSLLRDFDLLKTAGENQAVVQTFHGLTPNGQGTLLVSFNPIHDYASLYALEVIDESN
jgi:hypothetical protein